MIDYRNKEVDILGEKWTIMILSAEEDRALKKLGGYTDESVRLIVVNDFNKEKNGKLSLKDIDILQEKVLRHEIIHAFLIESGLSSDSNGCDSWSENEEMVDWFAFQLPKIVAICQEAGCF